MEKCLSKAVLSALVGLAVLSVFSCSSPFPAAVILIACAVDSPKESTAEQRSADPRDPSFSSPSFLSSRPSSHSQAEQARQSEQREASVEAAVKRNLIFRPIEGVCTPNKIYEIRSAAELEQLVDELPCVYAAGEVPLKVPLGLWEGQTMSVANTDIFNRPGEGGWAGKFSSKSQCGDVGTDFTYIQNQVFGMLTLPALTYIGKFTDSEGVGEESGLEDDEKAHLFCDYTVRWEEVCRLPAERIHRMNLGRMNVVGFGNANYDLLRMVGTTPDGGWLMLGRSILRDQLDPDNGVMTPAWWYVTSYDSSAFEGLPTTLASPNRATSFKSGGFVSMLHRVSPIEDFIRDPTSTFQRFVHFNFLQPLGMPATGQAEADIVENPMAGLPEDEERRVVGGGGMARGPFMLQGRVPPGGTPE